MSQFVISSQFRHGIFDLHIGWVFVSLLHDNGWLVTCQFCYKNDNGYYLDTQVKFTSSSISRYGFFHHFSNSWFKTLRHGPARRVGGTQNRAKSLCHFKDPFNLASLAALTNGRVARSFSRKYFLRYSSLGNVIPGHSTGLFFFFKLFLVWFFKQIPLLIREEAFRRAGGSIF